MRNFLLLIVLLTSQLALALNVTMSAKAEGGDRPTIVGKTNLPNGTELLVEMARSATGYTGQTKVVVQNGIFRAGPFSQGGQGLNSGAYALEILMPIPTMQSDDVVKVIGKQGKNLNGPLVGRSKTFGENIVKYKATIKIGETSNREADIASKNKANADQETTRLKSCQDGCNMSKAMAVSRNEVFSYNSCYSSCTSK
jgi:hypothetical protein